MTDADQVGAISKIELLQGGTVVQIADTLDVREFTGLTMYTKYTVRVHFRYDLNDGDGVHDAYTEYTLYTLPRFELTNIKIVNIGGVVKGDHLNLEIAITNPSGLLAESIVINGKQYYINPLGTVETFGVDIWIDESFNVGNTELVIEKITFVGDLENYEYIPTANNTVECVINDYLTITDVKLVDELGNELELVFPSSQPYFLVSFESATAYEIKSLVIGGKTYTDIEVVDANSVKVKAELSSWGIYAYELASITYGNEYLSERPQQLTDVHTQEIMLFQSDDIVEVRTADDLKNMGNYFHYYKLMNDIDLSGVSVENFGSFRGYFDGNNHTISGFTIEKNFYDHNVYLGLFESAEGVVKNLHIANVSISAALGKTAEETYELIYGGFAAYATDTLRFENVTHSGTVSLRNNATAYYYYGFVMGGLLGKANDHTVSFTDCINQAALTGASESDVGGILGVGNAVFTNCKNLADISGEKAGGFVCETSGSTFKDCENSGDVSGYVVGYAGGFVGLGTGIFQNCENTGNVSGTFSGGFIGNGSGYTEFVEFTECENAGNVSGCYTGGFIGYFHAEASFTKCKNNGSITSKSGFAGGFVGGYYNYTVSGVQIVFTDCENNGEVSVIEGNDLEQTNAGGFIGTVYEVGDETTFLFERCINTADITNLYHNAGGFIGNLNCSNIISFSDCTNSGAVTSEGGNASGFVAYMEKTSNKVVGVDVSFSGCKNNGAITSKNSMASGFVAYYNYGAYDYYQSKSFVISFSECENDASVKSEKEYAGALIGYLKVSPYGRLAVTSCTTSATVSGLLGNQDALVGGSSGEIHLIDPNN